MTLTRSARKSSKSKKKLAQKVALLTDKHPASPTFRCPSTDERLQAADKRRKYLRRGSKTPRMLLISAGIDLSIFENGMLPTEEKMDTAITPYSKTECSNATNFVAITTQKALEMAAAVDFLSETKLEELRMKERGVRLMKEKVHYKSGFSLSSIVEAGLNEDHQKMTESFHPRRLSAMTALKKNMEKASISTTSDTRSGESVTIS